MKYLLLASALATLAFPGAAAADDKDRWKDHQEAQREAWKDRREAEREYAKDRREAEREYWKDRREAEREYAKDRREAQKEWAKEHRRWARGDYIPRDYLADRYYVRDYYAYDLAPPPRGHRWVRPYQDAETFYLVQVATGLVSAILDD